MADDEDDERALIADVWRRSQPMLLARVTVIEDALAGRAPCAAAREEAHRLAGSLGSFGLPEGTEVARVIEAGLAGERPAPGLEPAAARLRALVRAGP